ncbi:MAG: alpha/beta fold hydrolase [Paracoccaceae bacterium]
MTEPLVLLPAMMTDARIFSHQIRHLSQERMVSVAPISGAERMEEIASSLLDQLPVRAAVAGVGMGAIVAMELARRAPDRVSRLCLMNTSAQSDTPAEAAERDLMIVRAKSGRLADVMQEVMRRDNLADGPRREDILKYLWQMGVDLGLDHFLHQTRAMQRRRDQQATLRKCHVPTLVLCGSEDGLTPVKRHDFIASLMPNARLEVIEGAGHLPMVEKPASLTALLHAWLAEGSE